MYDYRFEEPCKHQLGTVLECPICKHINDPFRPTPMVYVTACGDAFHATPNCDALIAGQQRVEERGGNPSPIECVPRGQAELDRHPCNFCLRKTTKGEKS